MTDTTDQQAVVGPNLAERLRERASGITTMLSEPAWKPSRSHIEAARNLLSEAFAALATQPATSQEGEAREPMAHLGVLYTVAGVMAEMLAVGTADDEGDLAEDWPLDCRADVNRWQAVIRNALAATPTPPTLSEDLRVLEPFVAHWQPWMDERDENGAYYWPDDYEMSCFPRVTYGTLRAARAALAQVKAS